jgi:hypothetical protein
MARLQMGRCPKGGMRRSTAVGLINELAKIEDDAGLRRRYWRWRMTRHGEPALPMRRVDGNGAARVVEQMLAISNASG